MKATLITLLALSLASCSKPAEEGVALEFRTSVSTKASTKIGNYFSRLNVMVFDASGNKVLSKVRTQTISDSDYGRMELSLSKGTYTIVAVGHSSTISASIKSTALVQFTASNGEKLTDTFSGFEQISIGDTKETHTLSMNRVVAMFRLWLTDDTPSIVKSFRFDYTGGSANYNPSTGQGITKSTQSETRACNGSGVYQVFSFPYLDTSGVLNITISALDSNGSIVRQRSFANVPITVNMITTYTGPFFEDGDGEMTQSAFGFSVAGDWAGEQTFTYE